MTYRQQEQEAEEPLAARLASFVNQAIGMDHEGEFEFRLGRLNGQGRFVSGVSMQTFARLIALFNKSQVWTRREPWHEDRVCHYKPDEDLDPNMGTVELDEGLRTIATADVDSHPDPAKRLLKVVHQIKTPHGHLDASSKPARTFGQPHTGPYDVRFSLARERTLDRVPDLCLASSRAVIRQRASFELTGIPTNVGTTYGIRYDLSIVWDNDDDDDATPTTFKTSRIKQRTRPPLYYVECELLISPPAERPVDEADLAVQRASADYMAASMADKAADLVGLAYGMDDGKGIDLRECHKSRQNKQKA
ncbi:hypothetical protein ml_358 [Mollivirus sibericum]|uniref:hypothetical protein n=1 Tax=Mollivirus sibericum TaxID=1678078 RepID=UPI0006B2E55E|nr:hypothetical protein ml_358 [Mollivirus sibericum]ALD62160.1 hypothetical protein ml_358 [Mollivirus sibericum]